MIDIKKFRNEWKYFCNNHDYCILVSRLSALLDKDRYGDEYGNYEIHSLYFDDYMDSCIRDNDAGIGKRFKYRIRYYGNRCQFLKLECKQKIYERCYKESCLISVDEYEQIMSGNSDELLIYTDKPLLKRFCVQSMTKQFMPKAIIDYKRTAYTDESVNFRVTIDKDISVSDDFEHFLMADYMRFPIQHEEQYVLEVKFDHIMPVYMRHVITNSNLIQSSISKYYLGRMVLQGMH